MGRKPEQPDPSQSGERSSSSGRFVRPPRLRPPTRDEIAQIPTQPLPGHPAYKGPERPQTPAAEKPEPPRPRRVVRGGVTGALNDIDRLPEGLRALKERLERIIKGQDDSPLPDDKKMFPDK